MNAPVKPTADPNIYCVGEGRAATLPRRMNDRAIACARALPGVIILVHGVNDIGTCYPAQEQGLCQGLNERLSRKDLTPAGYRLPPEKRDDKLEDDPDAVYFRRDEEGYSPVIPFYWGYREYFRKVQTETPTANTSTVTATGSTEAAHRAEGRSPTRPRRCRICGEKALKLMAAS